MASIARLAPGLRPGPLEEHKEMKLHTLAAVAALLASGLASAATVTVTAGAYSITYDDATPGFGAISNLTANGNVLSFEWSLQPAVQVQSFAAGLVSATFAIPDFTINASSGWVLNGLSSTLGNVTYFEAGASATTSLTAGGTLTVGSNPAIVLAQTPLTKVVSGAGTGWFAGADAQATPAYTTLTLSNASLVLTANAGPSSFAAITGQPQNKLTFSLVANPVPEPESYALMLAGLGIMGFLARRRRQG
jgi:hypothetical protein